MNHRKARENRFKKQRINKNMAHIQKEDELEC
jgi:hypothetical protein